MPLTPQGALRRDKSLAMEEWRCSSLTSLDLSSFDTSKVTDMDSMFYSCSALRELKLPEKFGEICNSKAKFPVNMIDSATNEAYLKSAIPVKEAAATYYLAYEITFSANGGSGSMDTQYVGIHGGTLNANTFTGPEDKIFVQWNTKQDGTGDSFADGGSITPTGNMTLYAQWGDPAAVVTAAPEAKTSLTYNGVAQELVSAGTANNGTMRYSTDNSTWRENIPTGTNAGDYTVYYKAVGSNGAADSDAGSVSVSIGQKEVGLSWSNTTLTYNGAAQKS